MRTLNAQIRCEELVAECIMNGDIEFDLSYLRPDHLPESLKEAKQLVKLILNECVLNVPDWISELTSLEHLDLRENRSVNALLPHIHKLKNLKWLSLAYDDVDAIPDSFSELSNLEDLNLDGSNFSQFPNVIATLTNLKSISLEYCRCRQEDIYHILSKLPCLKRLHLAFMQNYSLHESFDDYAPIAISEEIASLRNLEELDLSKECDICSLPENIDELKHLKILSLAQDIDDEPPIDKLPDCIVNIEPLETLDIYGCCNITILPAGMSMLRNLKKLDITRSGIKDISWLSREQLENMEDLHVQGKIPNIEKCRRLRVLNIYNNHTAFYIGERVSGIETIFEYDFPLLPSLETFSVYGGKLANTDFLLKFPNLRNLHLVCDMDSLPDGIDRLDHLEEIYISGAVNLKRLDNLRNIPRVILNGLPRENKNYLRAYAEEHELDNIIFR